MYCRGFLRREMLAGLLEHDRQFEFVVEFLSEMRREDYRLIRPDDGVHVLEEDNPRQHGMRETRLLGFVMVFAKVAGSMEELLGDDRRFDVNFIARVKDGFAINSRFGLLRRSRSPALLEPHPDCDRHPRRADRMSLGTRTSAIDSLSLSFSRRYSL